jgi:hypothetical protein
MIIIFEPLGRLGNRLLLSAYGMALAQASGQPFLNFSLEEYRDLFPQTRLPSWLPTWRFHKFVRAALVGLKKIPGARRWFVRLDRQNAAAHSPDNPDFVAAVKCRLLTIIEGWPDPARIGFSPQASIAIRHKFMPPPYVLRVARDTVERARRGSDLLVGLHIRQTDYREYREGIFYYDRQDYRRAMKKMTAIFTGRRVAFLVCSDQEQNAHTFAPFRITMGPGTPLGDLHSLAECDYVIGPPSTYSLWAAFYGSKPLYHMIEPDPPNDLSAFTVPDGRFECIDLMLDDRKIARRRGLGKTGIVPKTRTIRVDTPENALKPLVKLFGVAELKKALQSYN